MLLIYIISFLIGVVLYYVLNNKNIEKLNIGGGQLFKPYTERLIYPRIWNFTENSQLLGIQQVICRMIAVADSLNIDTTGSHSAHACIAFEKLEPDEYTIPKDLIEAAQQERSDLEDQINAAEREKSAQNDPDAVILFNQYINVYSIDIINCIRGNIFQ